MNNQRSVDEATLQMIVQRRFDAHQATEKLIKAHREHAGSDVGREEATVEYQRFIARDPKVCGGEPVIKGTRVTVRTVLASLAEGAKVEEILDDFPTLKEEDVRAVIAGSR